MRYAGSGTRLFPVALMAALAGVTFWLDRTTLSDDNGNNGKYRHDPDYMVNNFHVRRFDADGALQHSLTAQRMLHYPDDDSTRVFAPRLTYHRTPPTHLAADTAWLDKDGKHVELDGNVHIVRESIDDRPPTQIDTSVLYAAPDDEFAHTDAPVTITQGRTVINGTGLETNNKTHISVLYGPVKGTIYPRQAEPANPIHEPSPHEIQTPAHLPPADRSSVPAAGLRGKGGQG